MIDDITNDRYNTQSESSVYQENKIHKYYTNINRREKKWQIPIIPRNAIMIRDPTVRRWSQESVRMSFRSKFDSLL